MDLSFSKEQKALQDKSRIFADIEISPKVKELEEDHSFRQALFKKMAREGFFLLNVPASHGGSRIDSIAYALSLKEIAKADAGIAVAMSVTNMVAEAIYHYGTEQQRTFYLPRIADGSCVPAAFALTERNIGSDAKNIHLVARRENDTYLIDGEKNLITNADSAGVIVVMALTECGVSAFLIDRGTPGFAVVKKEQKLGLLTANLVRLNFTQCVIKNSQLLGEEGEGLKIALSSLDSGRLGIAAQAWGIAEAAFEAAVHYAKTREQFGVPIGHHQAIAFKLADMKVKLSAAEGLLLKACCLCDQNLPYTLEASEAKLFCSEAANAIADEALQIHGGYGYTKDYLVEKYFRDARATTLYEGTSEIQRLIISRHVLKSLL
jgi:hypothetical protein